MSSASTATPQRVPFFLRVSFPSLPLTLSALSLSLLSNKHKSALSLVALRAVAHFHDGPVPLPPTHTQMLLIFSPGLFLRSAVSCFLPTIVDATYSRVQKKKKK
eukprot:RCo046161